MNLDLQRITQNLAGAVCLISGRDLRDLCKRSDDFLWRVGGHGTDILPPFQVVPRQRAAAPTGLLQTIKGIIQGFEGVFVERKGAILAIHYRTNPLAGPLIEIELRRALKSFPDYRLQHGKYVLETNPTEISKGTALTKLMQQMPFLGRRPVMIGDDVTDESAFDAAQKMGGMGIKVGEGASIAYFRLPDVTQTRLWLFNQANGYGTSG